MTGTAAFSGFGGGGGGGRGPTIAKELIIIFGAWLAAKTWIRGNRPPPPDSHAYRFNRPIPSELYKYEKSRLIAGNFW